MRRLIALLLAGSVLPAFAASYDDLDAGIAARNRGDWDIVIADMDKAVAGNDLVPSLDYVAHLDRAEALAAKGRLEEALADLAATLAIRPGDKQVLEDRADLYIATSRPDAARQDLNAVIAADPTDDGAYVSRAETYEMQGDNQRALEDYQAARDRSGQAAGLDLFVGIAYFELGRSADASAAFTRAAATSPAYSWLWLAMTAVKAKTAAPTLSDQAKTQSWPGVLMDFFQGQGSEAGVVAAAAKGEAGDLPMQACEASYYLGEWRQLHGDGEGAKTLLQKAVSDCPKNAVEWFAAQTELKNAP